MQATQDGGTLAREVELKRVSCAGDARRRHSRECRKQATQGGGTLAREVELMISWVLAGGRPAPWWFRSSARMTIVAVLLIATLLMGTEGMEKSESESKRGSFIGSVDHSPRQPPGAKRSPGGEVTTPFGTRLVVTEKMVGIGQGRKWCLFFAPNDAISPVVMKQHKRLSRLDSLQRLGRIHVR